MQFLRSLKSLVTKTEGSPARGGGEGSGWRGDGLKDEELTAEGVDYLLDISTPKRWDVLAASPPDFTFAHTQVCSCPGGALLSFLFMWSPFRQ